MDGRAFIATSLDGYIARADGAIDWLMSSHDSLPGEDFGYADFIAGVDGLVMGSGTYRSVRDFPEWPYALPVVVMTANPSDLEPTAPEGKDVSFSNEAPSALVSRLDDMGWRAAYVDGGAVIRSFLDTGLIHEMIITRLPVLIGSGRPLFGEVASDLRLTLLGVKSWTNGLVQTRYRLPPQ